MKKKTVYWLLAFVFVISLAIRLYLAYQTPYFSTDSAYYHLRQIEHIRETGLPIITDALSYGGRVHIYLPFFDYILAFFSIFFPLSIVVKVVPNIFASSIVFIMYLLVDYIYKNKEVALLCASISAVIPIYLGQTLNSISVYSLSVPLFFLLLYYFLKSQDESSAWMYILLFCLGMLLHPSIIIVVLGLLIYYIILKIEKLSFDKSESEIFLFSLSLLLWFYILFYKKALLIHGFSLLWRNMPPQILINYFYNTSIIESIYLLGLIPLICGAYIIYDSLFNIRSKKKSKRIYLFISFCIIITLMLWMKLIEINVGLMYIGLLFVLLFSQAYISFHGYLSKTKLNYLDKYLYLGIFIIVIFSLLIPSFGYANEIINNAPHKTDINALSFMKEYISEDNVLVVADVSEANIVSYYTGHSTIADTDFILRDDVTERMKDIEIVYSTYSKIMASRVMEKYGADYIYLTNETAFKYNITTLPVEDQDCFHLVYTDDTKIYQYGCEENE